MRPSTGALVLLVYFLRKALLYIAYGTVISTYNNSLTLHCGASFLFIAVEGKGTASHIAIFGLTSLYYGVIILYVFDMGSNVLQIPTTKEVLK